VSPKVQVCDMENIAPYLGSKALYLVAEVVCPADCIGRTGEYLLFVG
jgi:hypothetical protein